LVNRRNRDLSEEDISRIADTCHNWRGSVTATGEYEDVQGFCKSATLNEVKALDYVITPGRYGGLAEEEDDFNFEERFLSLKGELEGQFIEEARLSQVIKHQLLKIRINNE